MSLLDSYGESEISFQDIKSPAYGNVVVVLFVVLISSRLFAFLPLAAQEVTLTVCQPAAFPEIPGSPASGFEHSKCMSILGKNAGSVHGASCDRAVVPFGRCVCVLLAWCKSLLSKFPPHTCGCWPLGSSLPRLSQAEQPACHFYTI